MTPQQRRDVGMQRVADSAGSDWLEQAVIFIDAYSRLHERFLTEHIRGAAIRQGMPNPPNEKAWGPAMLRAKREGLIRAVGYAAAASSNLSPKVLWSRA